MIFSAEADRMMVLMGELVLTFAMGALRHHHPSRMGILISVIRWGVTQLREIR
jgi:hypothetical protein